MTKAKSPPAATPKPERPRKGGSYIRNPETGKLARHKPATAPKSNETAGSAEQGDDGQQEA